MEAPMLVLSRQRDESIIIGDNVIVTVVDIRGDKVRLGITAPREISVHRQEVYEAIQRENMRAKGIDPDSDAAATVPKFPDRRNERPKFSSGLGTMVAAAKTDYLNRDVEITTIPCLGLTGRVIRKSGTQGRWVVALLESRGCWQAGNELTLYGYEMKLLP
jgi:carbon storage regulator